MLLPKINLGKLPNYTVVSQKLLQKNSNITYDARLGLGEVF